MDVVLQVAAVLASTVAVVAYLARGEEDSHLPHRVRAKIERFQRSPETVWAMDDLAFADHIAALCRRDGCTDVRRVTGTGGLGADVTGCLPDGRKVVVQCGRETGRGPVDGRDARAFHGTARARLGADVAILVGLGVLAGRARRSAARHRVTLIDVDRLESWDGGTPLSAMLEPGGGRSGTNRGRVRDG
ncbi:restriction endonuclease [Streptomyces sp. DH37]|uniref:restriction endonuclease n=1 Tax=Streptomyces sp. DH37 TaxID=3040122 RepID=UPI002442E0C9|nr:restriction endonuclease [Streptomyces sp. DH37]MDG9704137.1 restriction endonuclease [Streptomyces sp. DH37]